MKKKYKAIGNAIFTGSNFIGALNTNKFKIDEIMEISENCLKGNSMHLAENFPKLNISLPSVNNNDEYFKKLKNKDIDYFFTNPPCSGLSQINRHASTDNSTNDYLYESFTKIEKVNPKSFFIENAPTLASERGWPITKKFIEQLKDNYRLQIVRDMAIYHDVSMKRQRTFLIGYRKDYFDNKVFPLKQEVVECKNVYQRIADIPNDEYPYDKWQYNNIINMIYRQNKEEINVMINEETKNFPIITLLAKHCDAQIVDECTKYDIRKMLKSVKNVDEIEQEYFDKFIGFIIRDIYEKIIPKMNAKRGWWDKSHIFIKEDSKYAPSLTGVSLWFNLKEERCFKIREYARMMGYPDDFKLLDKVSISHLAQGVPANYAGFVHEHIAKVLDQEVDSVDREGKDDILIQVNNGQYYEDYLVDIDYLLESTKCINDCYQKRSKKKKIEFISDVTKL